MIFCVILACQQLTKQNRETATKKIVIPPLWLKNYESRLKPLPTLKRWGKKATATKVSTKQCCGTAN